jgi:hypothetical protein
MAFWGKLFKKPEKEMAQDTEVEIIDEETLQKRSVQADINRRNKQIKDTQYEIMRIKAEQERLEAVESLEELKEEKYLRRLERQARRQELEAQILGDDDEETADTPEMLFMSILGKAMNKNPTQAADMGGYETSPQVSSVVAIADDKILNIWTNLSAEQKAIAKHMSDDQLRAYIIGQIPQIDAPTVDKAIKIVRTH